MEEIKKSFRDLNAEEVERVIDEKDYQKNAHIRFVRKIFHDPQTIKLVYKDKNRQNIIFLNIVHLKLEDGQKSYYRNY